MTLYTMRKCTHMEKYIKLFYKRPYIHIRTQNIVMATCLQKKLHLTVINYFS